ncbi:hypothetical protein Tco_0639876 [Tanacetum coccineum]
MRRPIDRNTAKMSYFNTVKGNWGTADHPLKNMEDRGIFDSGCSGHMTGNKDHLDDFEEYKGGSVTFGGRKGYITGKGNPQLNQMLDYGFNFMNLKIHIDNESTICIVKNPVYHSKTKHIEIRHHFIRDSYYKKLIRVEKIHTDFNVADLLTKAFDGPRFKSGKPILILEEVSSGSQEEIGCGVSSSDTSLRKSVFGIDIDAEDYAKKLVELVEKRRREIRKQKLKAKKNKRMTQAEQRNYMMNYVRSQSHGWTIPQLKKLSFEELKVQFERTIRSIENFIPMDSEKEKESLKRSGETLQGAEKKKQKVLDVEDIPIPESAKFVKEEEIEVKQPVLKMSRRKLKARKGITWRKVLSTSLSNQRDSVIVNFGAMLHNISRVDLVDLYKIVLQKTTAYGPEEDLERAFAKSEDYVNPHKSNHGHGLYGGQRILILQSMANIMSSITAQQTKLDHELVPKENILDIEKCNGRIPRGLTPREPTFQVVLDAIALTPCYPAFLITADVPKVYMHQFCNSVYKHDTFYRFKIDKKKRFKLTLEVFRDIFQICPRVPGRDFDSLPSKEDTVSFLRELSHTGEINSLNDVVVDQMHQPWRNFAALINWGLSGKTSGLDKLRISRAQILWGMFYQKNVDYVELLWDDFIYQIENRVYKKQEKMYYP